MRTRWPCGGATRTTLGGVDLRRVRRAGGRPRGRLRRAGVGRGTRVVLMLRNIARVPRARHGRLLLSAARRSRSTTRRRRTRSPTWPATARPSSASSRTSGSSSRSSRCGTSCRRSSTWASCATRTACAPGRRLHLRRAARRPTRSTSTEAATVAQPERPGHASSTPRARPVRPRA